MPTVKLHCPNFWGFGRVYQNILQTPGVFKRDNTEIYSAYGCFPGMIWNGGRPQDHNKTSLERIAKEFEIYDALENKIESYSHGMRQKIVIIGVLLHDPHNWILDEPLTGLDPKSSFYLKQLMKNHSKHWKTVFFSTHFLEIAEQLCDRIAIINNGKILYIGTIEELKKINGEKKSLEEIFLEMIK